MSSRDIKGQCGYLGLWASNVESLSGMGPCVILLMFLAALCRLFVLQQTPHCCRTGLYRYDTCLMTSQDRLSFHNRWLGITQVGVATIMIDGTQHCWHKAFKSQALFMKLSPSLTVNKTLSVLARPGQEWYDDWTIPLMKTLSKSEENSPLSIRAVNNGGQSLHAATWGLFPKSSRMIWPPRLTFS